MQNIAYFDMKNYIALNIKYIRDKNKLSQNEFGEPFGLRQSTIATYESGRSNPPVELIQQICAHHNITIDDFINLDLSQQKYRQAGHAPPSTNESAVQYGNTNNDALIASMRETIESQRATIETQQTLIETLRDQLANAS